MVDADLGRRIGPLDSAKHRGTPAYEPTPAEVRALIAKAEGHDLGLRFLERGAQDAVAATFDVHAFVVDAARRELGG